MKIYKFDEEDEIDFLILGINSHVRPYKLCWEINKELNTNFVKTQNAGSKQKHAKVSKDSGLKTKIRKHDTTF